MSVPELAQKEEKESEQTAPLPADTEQGSRQVNEASLGPTLGPLRRRGYRLSAKVHSSSPSDTACVLAKVRFPTQGEVGACSRQTFNSSSNNTVFVSPNLTQQNGSARAWLQLAKAQGKSYMLIPLHFACVVL